MQRFDEADNGCVVLKLSDVYCETSSQCKPTSCGPNADCIINNHGVQCVCKPGYAGNPYSKKGCTQHLKHFCGSGDPHYVTYDNQHYNYQGTCPYVWSKVCNTSALPNNLPDFEVDAKNLQRYKNARVSYVEYGSVKVYGHVVIAARHQKVTVDGVKVTLPHYIPQKKNYKISIAPYGWGGTSVSTDFGLYMIYWANYRLCVFVPDVPGYIGNLCGLGGNMNGIAKGLHTN